MESVEKNSQNENNANLETEIQLTSNEEFHSIEINDLGLEVVGFVDKIRSPTDRKDSKVMSLAINNNNGTTCHVAAWGNDNIKKILSVELNNVIRIEGPKVMKIKNSNFNDGNLDYQLTIQQNTVVTILKKELDHCDYIVPRAEPKKITFQDVINEKNGYVRIEGFIKNPIRLLRYEINNELINYGSGALTDGHFKIEIKVNKFESNDQFFEKGDNVEVIGNLKTTNVGLVFIAVEEIGKVKIISEEKMTFTQIYGGYNSIVKLI